MKAKKIVGLMACAAACASFSSFAATTDWFGATPSGTEAGLSSATATGTFTVENGKFNIDNDEDTALKLTPTPDSAPATSDGIVIISATAELTPNSTNDLGEVTGAKAGFAVGVDDHDVTNYYGYANGTWTKLTGVNPTSAETSFKLVLDYRAGKKSVKFFVGDQPLSSESSETSFSIGDASALTSVDAFGTGSISSLDADCEVAEVAFNGVKYGSVADALADGGTMSDIKNVDSSGSISENATAANGLPMAVCVAAGVSVTDPAAVIATVPVDKDTNESNVTLKMAATGEPGVVVNFAVKQGGVAVLNSPFPANAILVPCATGIYTVEPVSVTVAP